MKIGIETRTETETETEKFQLLQKFSIESARYLPRLPPKHPCSSLHGHSFHITFYIEGILDPHLEWVMDYGEVNEALRPLLREIDHKVLNELPGLENPTTENLCRWLYKRAKVLIPLVRGVEISETSNSSCRFPSSAWS